MKWKKPSQDLIDVFDRIIPTDAGVNMRKMFGYPCGFMNGNMVMGIFDDSLFIRLSELDRNEFLRLEMAALFEPMPGRIMKEYVLVPQWMLDNTEELNRWIRKSIRYVSSLPRKAKKK